jgi:hypothetical protein
LNLSCTRLRDRIKHSEDFRFLRVQHRDVLLDLFVFLKKASVGPDRENLEIAAPLKVSLKLVEEAQGFCCTIRARPVAACKFRELTAFRNEQ